MYKLTFFSYFKVYYTKPKQRLQARNSGLYRHNSKNAGPIKAKNNHNELMIFQVKHLCFEKNDQANGIRQKFTPTSYIKPAGVRQEASEYLHMNYSTKYI